ncbi:hypothetical protein J1N35_018310 [Gossypium stocksii]|uniref:Uncharacterized protein n=1 Tax=Gossypium stocksii TaxID=47602 RepID=A0A9D3VQW0_9ROSI|nr:hypothetical protein J1N35_018310 [Gossypium stocksii]
MQVEITAGEISDKILDALEKIGCIDSSQGLPIPLRMLTAPSHWTVYPDTYGAQYLDAVDRIWWGRIQDVERSKASDLVSEQLRNRCCLTGFE